MTIKLKKNWLIIAFSIVLFSLISIIIAQAIQGTLVITVLDSNCDPISGADVIVKCGSTEVCNAQTNEYGVLPCAISTPTCSCPGTVDVLVEVGGDVKYYATENVDESCDGSLMVRDTEKCDPEYCVDGYCCDSACDGNCDKCDVGAGGTCTDVDTECTGNCDDCDNGNCIAVESSCETTYKCSDCTGSGTSFSCTYNSTENTDCDFCWKCTGLDTCGYQSSGEDLKDECPAVACDAENCDGSGNCQDDTADDGYSCVDDCTYCSSGSCLNRLDEATDECSTCEACNFAGGDCTGITAEDGKNCYENCSNCTAGSCVTRNLDDNVECNVPCYHCDGSLTSCVGQMSVDDGHLCMDDCTWCNGSSDCADRPQCDDIECSAGEYCDNRGGSCIDPNADSEAGENVCEACVPAQHNYGESWFFEGGTPYCCDNDANESYVTVGVGQPACCDDASENCVDVGGVCRDEYPFEITCDGLDNDCDGSTDEDLIQSCGSGNCEGTQTCIDGVWGYCSTRNSDCGICCICEDDNDPAETYDETQDSDCDACQKCSTIDVCVGSATDDSGKCSGCCDPDADGTCYNTGELESGKDCYKCTAEDTWNLDDASCIGNCDYCEGRNQGCSANDALCTGNCDDCVSGNCAADAILCTGNCDVCSGSGTEFNCQADNTKCAGTPGSCYCSGSGTSFNCQSCPDTYGECGEPNCSAYTCGNDPYSVGTDCTGFCKSCDGYGGCVFTSSGQDYQYECPAVACDAENCDGSGNCQDDTAADGYLCVDDCTYCNSGSCDDRAACDSTECSAGEYCHAAGGDCKGLEQDQTVCEVCAASGYTWTGNGDPLNCCGNDPGSPYFEDNPYEATEISCLDGNDNDCDGYIDGADPDCLPGMTITVHSPEQYGYYYKKKVPLNFTIDPSSVTWIGYSLNGATNETIPGPVNLTGIPDGNNSVIVYAKDNGNEAASDNVSFYYCLGDIIDDGWVSIFDVRKVAKAYDTYPGNKNWNPDADMNGDGWVSIFDVRIAAKEYNKYCPGYKE